MSKLFLTSFLALMMCVASASAYYEDFEDAGNLDGTLYGSYDPATEDPVVSGGILNTDYVDSGFIANGDYADFSGYITFNFGGNAYEWNEAVYAFGSDGSSGPPNFAGALAGVMVQYLPQKGWMYILQEYNDGSVWSTVYIEQSGMVKPAGYSNTTDYELHVTDNGDGTIDAWVQEAANPANKGHVYEDIDISGATFYGDKVAATGGFAPGVGGIKDFVIGAKSSPVAAIDVGDGVEVTEAAGAGHSDTYVISMNYSPPADLDSDSIEGVKLAMEYPNAQITVDPNANTVDVIFTAANWQTPQTVTVTAKDDSDPQGDRTVYIIHSLTLLDPDDNVISLTDPNVADPNYAYASIENGDVTVDIIDDEQRYEIVINELGGIDVSEQDPGANTDDYTVVLQREPTGTVMLDITTDGQTTVNPPALSFDSGNWNIPQTVTVTAVDDAAGEDDPHPGAITHLLNLPIVPVTSVYEDFEDEIGLNVTIDPNSKIDSGYLVGVGNIDLMENSIVHGGPYSDPTKIEMVFNMLGNTYPWTGPGIRVGYDETTDNSLLIFWRLANGSGQFAITDVVNGAWGPHAWLNVFGGLVLDPSTDYLITIVDYGMRMDVSLTEAANPSNVLLSAKGVDISSYTRLGDDIAIGSMADGVNFDGAAIGEVTVTKGQALTADEIEWLTAPIMYNPTASIADNDCRADRTTKVADLDDDCDVDLFDFAIFASEWLDCTLPNVPGCQ